MPFPSEARVVCRIFGTTADVKLGARGGDKRSHPVFNANDISRRLFDVPITPMGDVPNNDRASCLLKAQEYVKNELPVAYTVDPLAANAIALPAGHAWRDGRWVPTANMTYVAHAFPLLRAAEPLEDESDCKDPTAANDQLITLAWYVVIQPK